MDLDAAGKINISGPDVDTAVDDKMRIDADFFAVVHNLSVNHRNEFVRIHDFGILALRQCCRFSRFWSNLLAEYVLSGRSRSLGNTHGKYVADVRPNKDIHILIVYAVMGAGSGTPLDAHIKFLLDARIFSRLGGSAARSYEGRQIRKSALNCRAVDSVNNLLRSKRVNHIGDARRKIAVLLVKAHGRRHRIRRDLNTDGNDGILLPVSRRRIKFRFDAIGRAHKARQLQGVKIRDPRFFHFLLEAPDFDARAADLLRINGEIAAI